MAHRGGPQFHCQPIRDHLPSVYVKACRSERAVKRTVEGGCLGVGDLCGAFGKAGTACDLSEPGCAVEGLGAEDNSRVVGIGWFHLGDHGAHGYKVASSRCQRISEHGEEVDPDDGHPQPRQGIAHVRNLDPAFPSTAGLGACAPVHPAPTLTKHRPRRARTTCAGTGSAGCVGFRVGVIVHGVDGQHSLPFSG